MKPEELTSDLASYVNGTLDEQGRGVLKQRIDGDPAIKAEYEFLVALRKGIQASVPPVPDDLGLERVLKRIRAQRYQGRSSSSQLVQPVGSWERITSWLFQPPLSYALAASIFVVQLGVIGVLVSRSAPEYSEVRTQPIAPAPVGPFVRVSLKPDAREEDIRFLLIAVGASIIGGPTQLGDYYLFVPADRTDWVAQQLRQSPIADKVNVIATLPPAKE